MKKFPCFAALLFLLLPLSLALAGEDVRFTWDPYNSDPIAGYRLYMADAPNVKPIPANLAATIPGQAVTTFTQAAPPLGLHYWVLTAFTQTQESGPSNEVSYTVLLKPPSGFTRSVTMSFSGKATLIVTTSE